MNNAPLPATEESASSFVQFLLVIAAVTSVFIALFQFTLSDPIAGILTGAVLAVTFVSVILGMALDLLGYFESDTETQSQGAAQSMRTEPKPWVPTEGVRKPLPPLINFDDELAMLYESFGGSFPPQANQFLTDYRRLKTASNRDVIASDLRASLNPLRVLVDGDEELARLVDQMGDDLFKYLNSDASARLTVSNVAFYDNDRKTSVSEVQGKQSSLKAQIRNDGEAIDAEVAIEFYNDDVRVKREFLPIGIINPAVTKQLDTHVYVPANATRAEVTVVPVDRRQPAPGA